MDFLNPVALYGLAVLPLLLIPYLIRRKPRRVVFSSLLLFAGIAARTTGRPLGRLRLPWLFFLQLLLLTLLVFALSEPVFSIRPRRIAIVLDNSASMQTLEGDRSRFQMAQDNARNLLTGVSATGTIDIYLTTPKLGKVRGGAFTRAQASGVIAGFRPYDMGDPEIDYDKALNQLAADGKYDRVYFITDHPVRGQGGRIRVTSVGTPQDNIAITAFQTGRASFARAQTTTATAEVTNYSAKDVKTRITVSGGGAIVASRDLSIPAGQSASVFFDALPNRAYYEAEIATRDALLIDNRSFAVPPANQNLRILAVSPRPGALSTLRAIPGVTLDIVSPADYPNTQRSGYDLEIFHFASPAELPKTAALLVLPPDNALVALGKPLTKPAVSNWREPHPLTQYVNFSLLRPTYARALKPRVPGETVMDSPEGPLVFAAQRGGVHYLVLGFDPFPYLGRENLPMSVFTLNIFNWFVEHSAAAGKLTGSALSFRPLGERNVMITPVAEKIPLRPGATSFSATFYEGIYQLTGSGEKELFAVNLRDPNESDLRRSAPLDFRRAADGPSQSAASLFAFWPYLLIASLLLMVIEWFLHPRAARSASKPPARGFVSRHA